MKDSSKKYLRNILALIILLAMAFALASFTEFNKKGTLVMEKKEGKTKIVISFITKGDEVVAMREEQIENIKGFSNDQIEQKKKECRLRDDVYGKLQFPKYKYGEKGDDFVVKIAFSTTEEHIEKMKEENLLRIEAKDNKIDLEVAKRSLEKQGFKDITNESKR